MSVLPTGHLELAVHAVKHPVKSPWSISSPDFIFSYDLEWENRTEKKPYTDKAQGITLL